MSIAYPKNERAPWSRITDTSILRPGDSLRLVGANLGIVAVIGILDSHDPSASPLNAIVGPIMRQPPLPNHHHALISLEGIGRANVLSTGIFVGSGEPEDLVFPHVTYSQNKDDFYKYRLIRLHEALSRDRLGMYYACGQETLSATPEGQAYLDSGGRLLR